MNEKATFTVPEIANILGIGRNKAYDLVKSDNFPVLRVGKRLIVPKTSFERWLNSGITGYEVAIG